MNFLKLEDTPSGPFMDQDTKELYKKNLRSQPGDWRYRNKLVKYTLNTHNYRTKEFNIIPWADSVVIFGCSFVFGIGAALDETIAAQLSSIIQKPVINMGAPGTSAMFSLYNSSILRKDCPKPAGIVFGWTASSRCTLFLKDSMVHCGSWMEDVGGLGKAWRRFDDNASMHLKFTRQCAQQMWDDVPYADFTLFPSNRSVIDCQYIRQVDYGRDCCHSGVETNRQVAVAIAEQLNL
tara:strand:- start:874 stop:1581 length:708 start_codon:yes stop_codon:yes gene_type:complete